MNLLEKFQLHVRSCARSSCKCWSCPSLYLSLKWMNVASECILKFVCEHWHFDCCLIWSCQQFKKLAERMPSLNGSEYDEVVQVATENTTKVT